MIQTLVDFLVEKARGFIITLSTTGVGAATEVVTHNTDSILLLNTTESLKNIAFLMSIIVATLTTISFLYKGYVFAEEKGIHKFIKKYLIKIKNKLKKWKK